MKTVLPLLFAASLPQVAFASVSQMFCVLSERTPNPHLNRSTKSVEAFDETGVAATLMGVRYHAQVKVEMDGSVRVRIYQRTKKIVEQNSVIALAEETSFGAETEPTAEGNFATLRCRLF